MGMYDPKTIAGRDSNGATVSLRDLQGASYYIEYSCLPDTIDPRGPKGK